MADPLEAYNAELNKRSQSYEDMNPQQFLDLAQGLGMGIDAVSTEFPGLGSDFGGINRYLERKAEDSYKAIDTSILEAQALSGNQRAQNELANRLAEGVRSGKIPESEIPLGTDLVDIFGDTDPTLGAPDFVTNDYNVGEIFKFDPTGEGKTKGMPETKADREGREAKEQLDAEIQAALDGQFDQVAAQKKKDDKRAEDFRKKEAQIAGNQGGLQSMTVEDSEAVTEQMFASAMQDYIEGVRGTGPDIKDPKSIEEYKEEFAKATGISIDGKPDKSQALMAFGLELMRNKAGGKGVTGMLDAIGVAGQAAMPALEKARERVRKDGIAAGKFALEMKSADQAKALAAEEKAMERSDYFIVPKSNDVKGFLAGIGEGKGKLESLSKYELNALQNNPDFKDKFDVLPQSMWGTIVSEALKSPDSAANWDDKVVTRALIPEIDDPLFSIDLSYGKPGTKQEGQYVIRDAEQLLVAEDSLLRMMRDNNKAREQFIELGILTSENRNIFTYGVDKLNSLASAFNIRIGEDETETDTIIRILENIAMKKAPEILGESGKTISDGDRERVERIVGQLKAGGDIRTVRARIQELFNDIIIGAENDITQGLTNLSRYTKKDYGLGGNQELNEEETKELAGYEGT